MKSKPVTYEGLRFWMGEFLSEGKGWKAIRAFLLQECEEKRIEKYHIADAERLYNSYRIQHKHLFPED